MPDEFEFHSLHLVGAENLGRRWRSVLGLGIALMALGGIATATAPFLTLASMVLIGSLLMFVGLLQGLHAFVFLRWGGVFIDLLGGILAFVLGLLIIANPGTTAEALTLLIALYLILGGMFRIAVATMVRFHHAGWLLLHGVINVLLGVMIWQQWPMSGHVVIGLFIGIDLLFNGLSLVMLGLAARRLNSR